MNEQIMLSFQLNLYKKIIENEKLYYNKKNIFNFIPQKSSFPFIYIGNYSISDWSNKTMYGLKVIFSIIIFSKMQTNKEIIELSSDVSESINEKSLNLGEKYLANIKIINSKLEYIGQRSIFKNLLRFQANIEEL